MHALDKWVEYRGGNDRSQLRDRYGYTLGGEVWLECEERGDVRTSTDKDFVRARGVTSGQECPAVVHTKLAGPTRWATSASTQLHLANDFSINDRY